MATRIEAPITAVTVYVDGARVVRSGRVTLPAGTSSVTVADLPTSLRDDSVRAGAKSEVAVRLGGVEVTTTYAPHGSERGVAEAVAEVDRLRDADAALADEAMVIEGRLKFLATLSQAGATQLAKAVAKGSAQPSAADGLAGHVATQQAAARGELREVDARRRQLARELEAAERQLDHLRGGQSVQRRNVELTLELDAGGEVDVEVSYVVNGASWSPSYDATVEGERLTLTYHGLVRQFSGEDWPSVPLVLSTARPSASTTIPELPPWYVDEDRPYPMAAPVMRESASMDMGGGAAPAQKMLARAAIPAPAKAEVAEVGRSGTAVTFKIARAVQVPSDGSPHKAVIAMEDLDAVFDHIAVPRIAEEVYLRATVTNTSVLTLLPGPLAVHHGSEYVGTTHMELTAPGGEVELQLGVDDRVEIERELVKRAAGRALLSGGRTALAYRTTVTSHLPAPAKIRVVDGYPVSVNEEIKVKIDTLSPEPAERTDLGVCTWELVVKPEASVTIGLAFTLEHPRGMRLSV